MTTGRMVRHAETRADLLDGRGNLATYKVLKAFDRARRQLALRETGSEGAFAGYDTLEINSVALS